MGFGMKRLFKKLLLQIQFTAAEVLQSFPYETHCECYKKFTSRSLLVLFTLTYFSYIYTVLFHWKISCCDRCFPQQIRPQITVQLYVLQDYSSVRTDFNIIYKCHTLPRIHQVSLNPLSFDHYYIHN